MAEIYVLTNAAGSKFADCFIDGTAMSPPSYFKIGEGGWTGTTTKAQRDPSQTLTDVDALANPSRYDAGSRYVFTKSFVGGDITKESIGIAKCRCFLDFDDANDDGFGNDPEFWELGIFDDDDVMIAYGTFPMETKNAFKQLSHSVRVNFGGG